MRSREGGAAATETAGSVPAEVSWEMLDKSRFFVLGAALFSGVSAALYPAVVLKTHLQVITFSNCTSLCNVFSEMVNLEYARNHG
jgi:hypothetical protein